jgi:16S rRNA (adenine1518-N6/adenine1519-N6)-dimethyltransferase
LSKKAQLKEKTDKRIIYSTLSRLGVKPSKERGQNFIISDEIISDIINFGNPSEEENLLEIGPGLGALTEQLAHFPNLILVEIENNFCVALADKFKYAEVICADIRTLEFAKFNKKLTVFGNLPYSFSTDILFHLIEERSYIKRAILLFQKEFAERILAPAGKKSYGVLSIMSQIHCTFREGPEIAGDKFAPPTVVNSKLIELIPRVDSLIDENLLPTFELVVRASFSQRRKKLINSLLEGPKNNNFKLLFDRLIVENSLRDCNIDPARRAETLSIEEFKIFSESLKRKVEGSCG